VSSQRPGGALAQHRHAGQQEHDDEREDPEHDQTDPVEDRRLRVEHEPQQREQHGRDDDDHGDGAAVVTQLTQDPRRRTEGDPE